jgi:hypothetical protein
MKKHALLLAALALSIIVLMMSGLIFAMPNVTHDQVQILTAVNWQLQSNGHQPGIIAIAEKQTFNAATTNTWTDYAITTTGTETSPVKWTSNNSITTQVQQTVAGTEQKSGAANTNDEVILTNTDVLRTNNNIQVTAYQPPNTGQPNSNIMLTNTDCHTGNVLKFPIITSTNSSSASTTLVTTAPVNSAAIYVT